MVMPSAALTATAGSTPAAMTALILGMGSRTMRSLLQCRWRRQEHIGTRQQSVGTSQHCQYFYGVCGRNEASPGDRASDRGPPARQESAGGAARDAAGGRGGGGRVGGDGHGVGDREAAAGGAE